MIVLAYGMPGFGKTLLLHQLVREQPGYQYFVVDRTGDWSPSAEHWSGRPPKNLYTFHAPKDLPRDGFPDEGVFVFPGWENETVAQMCIDNAPAVLVDDELDLAGGKVGSWEKNPMREFIHRGRHVKNKFGKYAEVHLFGACRRPQSLHTDFGLATEVYIFRCQGDATLNRLRADAFIRDEEMERIQNLERFECRHWPSGKYLEIAP